MKIRKLSEGDIIEIQDSSGATSRCMILFVSKVYKDVILLGVLDTLEGSGPTEIVWQEITSLVYTSCVPIKQGRWKAIDQRIELPNNIPFSLCVATDSVWLRDKQLRPVRSSDRNNIPRMSVAGMIVVENYIAYTKSGSPDSKFSSETHATAKNFLMRLREETTEVK